MKAIISRKLYDTDTATRIASWSNGLGGGDFSMCLETLYQTQSSALFLFGEGGANSMYAHKFGNTASSGWEITPLSKEEACDWCEKRGMVGEALMLFPDMIRDA